VSGVQYATAGLAWMGWSWAVALAGAIAALGGAATGRRGLAALGALVLASDARVGGRAHSGRAVCALALDHAGPDLGRLGGAMPPLY
jgi:hypothetical protein